MDIRFDDIKAYIIAFSAGVLFVYLSLWVMVRFWESIQDEYAEFRKKRKKEMSKLDGPWRLDK